MQTLLPLIPALPLLGFIITGLFGKQLPKSVSGIVATAAVFGAFVLSVMAFNQVSATGGFRSDLFTWVAAGDWNIGASFLCDNLSAMMMLIITGIGMLIHIYSMGYMHDDEGYYKFFAYLNLFIFSMLLLVMGSNYMMMFFGWEGVGLCSYLLIGFWYENSEYGKAARKAFIMNRIGDLGLLLGVFFIFAYFGTTDYAEVLQPEKAAAVSGSVITAICLLLFVGAMGKSAQIPLYTWLPDAMAGPTPVSALIHAATMVTAGIYMIVRSNVLYNLSPVALSVVALVGLATSIFAALIGLRQNDIKKILAYSTVSQLGLMFLALGVGAYSSAMFHLTTHAFFKALLFLGAGSVIHAMSGEQDIRNMGNLRGKLPITHAVMLIGTLAIIGFPMFSGFVSKDEILANVYASNGAIWWGLTALSALLTAVYMSRMYFVTFYGDFRGTHDQEHHLHESPLTMTVPLMVLAVLSIFGGLLNLPHFLHIGNPQWLAGWLSPLFHAAHEGAEHTAHHLSESTELSLMMTTTAAALIALVACGFLYTKSNNLPVADAQQSGLTKVLANKFYVDEIYDAVFVKPIAFASRILHKIVDIKIIDGIVNGVGKTVMAASNQLRKLQTGNIEFYLFGMVTGIVLVVLSIILSK